MSRNLSIELGEKVKVPLEISGKDRFDDDEAKSLEVGVVEVNEP